MASPEKDLVFAPEAPRRGAATRDPWKLMIVDDEHDVHAVTKLALDNFVLDGRSIRFLDAYTGREAVEIMAQHPDTALVLMDIVMESERAGLDAIEAIRKQLGNRIVRIVVRTGHPGQAPERDVVTRYDINDYKEKTELTAKKLFTTVYTGFSLYDDLASTKRSREALDRIATASATVLRRKIPERLARGALQLLAGVLGVNRAAKKFGAVLVADVNDPKAPIIAGLGKHAALTGVAIGAPEAAAVREPMQAVARMWDTGPHAFAARIKSAGGHALGLYLETERALPPIDAHVLDVFCRSVDNALHVARLNQDLQKTQYELIMMLSEAIELRSQETGNHVRRVGEYSRMLARYYGLPADEADNLLIAAALHDAGKIAIPDAILMKAGSLTREERGVMEKHAQIGSEMFAGKELAVLREAAIIAGQHHERWDGLGYPRKLKGEEIHVYGRIVALADVFDALGSHRCYKRAWPVAEVVKALQDERGRHFEPRLVDLLLKHLDAFLAIRDRFKDPPARPH
jgi:response regulator RpfG family c-di-GMP phosphodiesterase